MARRRRPGGKPVDGDGRSVVVVCRGGDCGSRRKHPGFDHQQQLRTIRDEAGDKTRVVISRCLDACEHSNVVVIIPADPHVGEPVWIGGANDNETTADIITWLNDETNPARRPVLVDIRQFGPTRLNRHELEDEVERGR